MVAAQEEYANGIVGGNYGGVTPDSPSSKSPSYSESEIDDIIDSALKEVNTTVKPLASLFPNGTIPYKVKAKVDEMVIKACEKRGIPDVQPLKEKLQTGGQARLYLGYSVAKEEGKPYGTLVEYFIKAGLNGDTALFRDEGYIHYDISRKTKDVVPEFHGLAELKIDDIVIPINAMEFIHGDDLHDYVKKRKEKGEPFSKREKLQVFKQIVEKVSEIHKAGYVHRDLKPENVMIKPDGDVRVADPGIASKIGLPPKNERISGTPHYFSPEHILSTVDPRMDVYSLGCMLYEMMAGKTPFNHVLADIWNKTPEKIETQFPAKLLQAMLKDEHLNNPSQGVKKRFEGLSNDITYIINKCMKRYADERFDSCDELASALGKVLEQTKITQQLLDVMKKNDPEEADPFDQEQAEAGKSALEGLQALFEEKINRGYENEQERVVKLDDFRKERNECKGNGRKKSDSGRYKIVYGKAR